jgi:hypothetical protein
MRRREIINVLIGAMIAAPWSAAAQTASKVYRIGLLNAGPPIIDNSPFGARGTRQTANRRERRRNSYR